MERSVLASMILASVLATGTAAAAATAPAPALPAPGPHAYDLTGSSNLGPLPAELRLTVGDGGAGAQKWTMDATNPDGSGVIQQLTLARHADGLYLSTYHLQASSSLIGVDYTFSPPAPVLLVPDAAKSWTFDMGSSDGCVKTHTTAAAPAAGAKEVHLVTDASGTGKSGCVPVDAKLVQDITFPGNSYLPTRIDTDLSGHLSGAPAKAKYRATLRKGQ